jgi:hypothetical protein
LSSTTRIFTDSETMTCLFAIGKDERANSRRREARLQLTSMLLSEALA